MIRVGNPVASGIRVGAHPGNIAKAVPAPINLLLAALDSRVTYNGPAHAYYKQAGGIAYSAANEWPLEYKNGVAVGRHEPERASTNYQPSSNFESLAAVGTLADWQWSVGNPTTVEDSTSMGTKVGLSVTGSTLTSVYSEVTSAFLAAAQDSGSPTTWTDIVRKFTIASAGIMRWYTARQSSTIYLYGRTVSIPAGAAVASVFRVVNSNGVYSALAQVELGANRTSPIIAGVGASAARAAATLTVAKDGAATGITLVFSDGTTTDMTFSGSTISVPVGTADWGTRYLTAINYKV